MLKLPIRAAFAAACLLLTMLFAFKSALADTPSTPADAIQTTIITLQNVVPGAVIKEAQWDHAELLPVGVSQIRTQPANNALVVVATSAGLKQVREIVAGLDIALRQVQIKLALAAISDERLAAGSIQFDPPTSPHDVAHYASGKPAALLLSSLTNAGGIQSVILTTTDNTEAQMSFGPNTVSYQVTPRINSDNAVTLEASVALPPNTLTNQSTDMALKALLTVKNGETRVLVKKLASGSNVLLFVTPTVLPKQ